MGIHKLADGPITLTIAQVEETEGNFGAQIAFTGTDNTTVFVSELSAARQLARLNLTHETVIGETLHFEQVKKDGKTFTNINRAVGGGSAPAAPSMSSAAKPAMSVADIAKLYGQCVDAAISTIGVKLEGAEIPFDGSVIQAAAATMFIKASR